ncbi:hypothetical protein Asp14428_73660 [Actinoplanes sp. NBRC 14428]|nr:hypothetical protein Asp14428_73660 [Actinoplanes sp. NBRC 14428]
MVLYDLRPHGAAQRFRDRYQARGGTKSLVIVQAADLEGMRETIFDIAAARTMLVIYLVIGQPPEGLTHKALEIPHELGSSDVATLWVSDQEGKGCGLWIDSDRPMVSADAILGSLDKSPIDLLADCLLVPDVFLQVLRHAAQMPDHVASPGLVAIAGQLGQRDVVAARVRSLRALIGTDEEPSGAVVDDLASLVPSAPVADLGNVLVPGGEVAHAREQARAAAQVAEQVSRGVAWRLLLRRRSPRHPATVVEAARGSVAGLQRVVASLLNAGHQPGERLSPAVREKIRVRGVELANLTSPAPEAVVEALSRLTGTRLRGGSVTSVQGWLSWLADAATPHGSADQLRRLPGADEHGATLPPVLLPPAPPWLLGLLAVACALGGLSGRWPGVAVGATAMLVVAFLLSRPAGGVPVAVAVHLLGIGAGVAAGLLTRQWLSPPGSLEHVPAAVGLVAVLAGTAVWWAAAARRWIRAVDHRAPVRDVQAVEAVLRRVIFDEWRVAPARAQLADTAVAARIALQQAGEVLRERCAQLEAEAVGVAVSGTAADGGLDTMFTDDLRDAVEDSLSGFWQVARSGSPAHAWQFVAERMTQHVEEHDQHLATHPVNDRPPFARKDRPRPAAAGGWGPPDRLAQLLETPIDGPLVQLCRERHISLLSLNRTRGVRFAPAALQDAVKTPLVERGNGHLLNDIEWTTSGSLAGVVRLVAPRPGVVDLTWREEEPDLLWDTEEGPDDE